MHTGTKTEKRPRGRPRNYDSQQALNDARDAFWHSGYSATSLDALSEATGMNRPSLYGAFGDKHALYLDTLERYIALGRDAMQAALDGERPLADALLAVYEGALALYFPHDEVPRGCFLIGTAAVESRSDAQVRDKLARGLATFDKEFERRLERAQAQGELDAAASPALLAKIASAILHTLALRSRAGDSRESLRATAQAGVALICGTAGVASSKALERTPVKSPRKAQSEPPGKAQVEAASGGSVKAASAIPAKTATRTPAKPAAGTSAKAASEAPAKVPAGTHVKETGEPPSKAPSKPRRKPKT